MCGILCEICYQNSPSFIKKDVLDRIDRRGPDCIHTMERRLDDSCLVDAYFHGSVLWMQGPQITPQPIESRSGILLFNGDIFDDTWATNISDTELLLNKLSEKSNDYREDQIIKVIRSLKGPFGLIYFDTSTGHVYFTRDRIGRSTLLFFQGNENEIAISSVLDRNYENCVEIPAANIFSLNMKEKLLNIYSWTGYLGADIYSVTDWFNTQKLQQSIPDDAFYFDFDQNIDLSDNDNLIKYIEATAMESTEKLPVMTKLMENSHVQEVVLRVTQLLEESIRLRVSKQPNQCKDCVENKVSVPCNHCTVGVLFSGGLDCTILALLANKFVPKDQQIDLINVAFKKDEKASYDVPDRLTGRQSFEELKKLCPFRIWNFKEVNISNEELEEFKSSTIAHLVYPRKTVLDESLGCALWFAARGKDCNNAVSSCRVLLLGSGADELFGGYIRHRNAFKRQGWTGLAKELMLDWKRISVRNLSRDNRVISDHGRQPRMPYLDDDFTEYVLRLKPWLKCFPSTELGPGIGDKIMLRLVALNLGLSEVVTFPKRALQFGSRIANKKENGGDLSKSFVKPFQ